MISLHSFMSVRIFKRKRMVSPPSTIDDPSPLEALQLQESDLTQTLEDRLYISLVLGLDSS